MATIVTTVADMRSIIETSISMGRTVGFVPTMGALHSGHVSLVKKARRENDIVIISIFVNPTQFNDKKDLEKYPRTLDADVDILAPTSRDIIFAPTASEIYPNGMVADADIDLGGLDQFMEGAFRPGHFKGMAQVVKRLLDIVTPHKLYMGQKDFQQFTIVAHFIKNLHINTELIVCKIIREPNGLAMSSRNERLTKETRTAAGIIYKTLQAVKKIRNKKPLKDLETYGMQKLAIPPFEPEYLSIVDGYTLQPLTSIDTTEYAVACVAVWADGVRLIDNIILKKG